MLLHVSHLSCRGSYKDLLMQQGRAWCSAAPARRAAASIVRSASSCAACASASSAAARHSPSSLSIALSALHVLTCRLTVQCLFGMYVLRAQLCASSTHYFGRHCMDMDINVHNSWSYCTILFCKVSLPLRCSKQGSLC